MKTLRNGIAIAMLGAVALTACGGDDVSDAIDDAQEQVEDAQDAADDAQDAAENAADEAAEAGEDVVDAAEEVADDASDAAQDPRQKFIDELVASGVDQAVAECVADEMEGVLGEDFNAEQELSTEEAQKVGEATAQCVIDNS